MDLKELKALTFKPVKRRKAFYNYLEKIKAGYPPLGEGEEEHEVLITNFVLAAFPLFGADIVLGTIHRFLQSRVNKTGASGILEEAYKMAPRGRGKLRNKTGARGGVREDIGPMKFRSAFEANVARYFRYMEWKWEYEPERFQFEKNGKRGPKSYLPDFLIDWGEGPVYVEVKGRFFTGDKTRISKFLSEYSDKKLIFITNRSSKEVIEFAVKHRMTVFLVEDFPKNKITGWE